MIDSLRPPASARRPGWFRRRLLLAGPRCPSDRGRPLAPAWARAVRAVVLAASVLAAFPPAVADTGAVADLEGCRDLRGSRPAEALESCERAGRALQAQARADEAFEALMHAAQLAAQLGSPERSVRALEQATVLLPKVQDALAGHRLARRRALIAYRDGRLTEALSRFLEAQATARAARDPAAIAVSDNDLGVVYRHLGDYPSSLQHFQASLEAKERLGERDLGSSLANVGSLYLELGDAGRARHYLERALAAHRESGRPLPEMQTVEELARVAEWQGDADAAREALQQAWRRYGEHGSLRDRLRVALRLAALEESLGFATEAAEWLGRAGVLSAELGGAPPIQALLLDARLATGPPAREAAYVALRDRMADDTIEDPVLQAEVEGMLAELAELLGRPSQALVHLREQQRRNQELAAGRHAQRLDALRVRFEVAQLESERDQLAAQAALQAVELQRRRALTLVVALAALFALAALGLWSQRRLYRHRLEAQRAHSELEQRIEQARRSADLLRSDLRSLAWLLDRQRAATLVFDAGGRVRLVTAAAAQRFGSAPEQLQGRALVEVLGADVAGWAQAAVESDSLRDADASEAVFRPEAGGTIRCRRLALEEELGVIWFEESGGDALATLAGEAQEQPAADGDRFQRFREQLVALMQASLNAWERATRRTRIDLAEASGVWRLTVDDGRLRVRTMDRYLSLESLPERPRWREVLRTAYFVLAEHRIDAAARQRLEQLVESVLAATHRP